MKAHFIGIGGVGMSATATLLRDSGWDVTGSDEAVYPPMSTQLAREKLVYRTPYAAENIPPDVDVIVIGKNAKLVPETNAEVAAALKSGKRITSFPEMLGELSQHKQSVVVAGSYGKSSCVALLAHVLQQVGLDPSFFIGAVPISPPTSARIGKGDLFVFEGDEYPSSNTDNRSKFLHLHPKHVLLTPLAHDHVNIYPTVPDYLAPFYKLVEMLPDEGSLVAATSGPLSREFLVSVKRPVVTYGLHQGHYTVANIQWGAITRFDIVANGSPIINVGTSQLGEHSIENILAVAAFVFVNKLVSPDDFAKTVASFKGVTRRLDCKSDKTSVAIYEGFGSSYDKARSAIAAVKRSFNHRRLIIVFEPHTFSWRSRDMLHWYDDAFAGADATLVYQPATQGAGTHNQVSHAEIMERLKAAGHKSVAIIEPQQALDYLREHLKADDVLLLLTSGPLGGLVEAIPALAEQRFPKH